MSERETLLHVFFIFCVRNATASVSVLYFKRWMQLFNKKLYSRRRNTFDCCWHPQFSTGRTAPYYVCIIIIITRNDAIMCKRFYFEMPCTQLEFHFILIFIVHSMRHRMEIEHPHTFCFDFSTDNASASDIMHLIYIARGEQIAQNRVSSVVAVVFLWIFLRCSVGCGVWTLFNNPTEHRLLCGGRSGDRTASHSIRNCTTMTRVEKVQ